MQTDNYLQVLDIQSESVSSFIKRRTLFTIPQFLTYFLSIFFYHFNFNFMKKTLLLFSTFLAYTCSYAQDCSKIFLSEYVEGHGNNKAIEIYNPTDLPVDMTQYFLQRYSNGSTTASAQGAVEAKTIQLVGTIPAKGTLVYVIDQRDPLGTGQTAPIWTELEAKADYFLCNDYDVNNVMFFNGNDALLLAKGDATNPMTEQTVLIDIFGKIGEDPEVVSGGTFNGWTSVAPYNGTSGAPNDKVVTENHSMIRKSSIKKGVAPTGNPTGIVFNPLLEWDSIPALLPKRDGAGNIVYQTDGITPQWIGNWESLGFHACTCDPNSMGVKKLDLSEIKLYPNPTTGAFTLSGLEKVATIEVINALGKVISEINNNTQSSVTFDLSNEAGIYFVTVTDINGYSATQKVIVK